MTDTMQDIAIIVLAVGVIVLAIAVIRLSRTINRLWFGAES